MTFRENLVNSICDGILDAEHVYYITAVTKYKKDAEAILREFRDRGPFRSAVRVKLEAQAAAQLRPARLYVDSCLNRSYVTMSDMSITMPGVTVRIVHEKNDLVQNLLGHTTGSHTVIHDIVVEDACSKSTKDLASDLHVDEEDSIVKWLDQIPINK